MSGKSKMSRWEVCWYEGKMKDKTQNRSRSKSDEGGGGL